MKQEPAVAPPGGADQNPRQRGGRQIWAMLGDVRRHNSCGGVFAGPERKRARGEAARFDASFKRYLRYTPDTAVKAVVLEDSAALVGLVLAAGGLLGGQLTGSGVWDGIASLCIGLLLLYVAWVLGRSNAELLIGRPLPKAMRDRIREELLAVEHIEAVLELTTLVQGPREALVAAKVDFRDVSTAAQIEWACEQAEQRLREAFPAVSRVYLDPTPGYAQRRAEGLNPWP